MGLPLLVRLTQPRGVENHHDQGRQHVGYLDFYGENHVYAHAEDKHGADHGHVVDHGCGEEYLDGPGQQSDAPLEQKQRDGGENGSHPEGGGEDGHDDAVQKSLGVEHGRIAGQAVLKGADDGHGSHADGESGHDEAVDEFGVFFPAGFLSKPVPEFHKSFFNVHPLTNDGAQSQGHGAHHGARPALRAARPRRPASFPGRRRFR